MQDIFDNSLLLMKIEHLGFGVFDDENYIVSPNIIDKIAIYKYMRALIRNDKVRSKLDTFSKWEFTRETYIVHTIGYYLLDSLEKALSKHDKEGIKKYMELIKKETARINSMGKVKNGFKSTMTRSAAEAILTEYLGEEASNERILDAYPGAKIIEFRKPGQNKEDKPTF